MDLRSMNINVEDNLSIVDLGVRIDDLITDGEICKDDKELYNKKFRSYEALFETLSEEQKKLMLKYEEDEENVERVYNDQKFIMGFKSAVILIMEVMR